MHMHSIHHVPFEGPAGIAQWAESRGVTRSETWQHRGDPLPDLDEIDFLVVTGGPMSVGDSTEYPWLVPELALIREAMRRETPVLGICLGAQLMAAAAGAQVLPMKGKEIGWYPVHMCPGATSLPWMRSLPSSFTALHWHGDQFDIPRGAVPLWSSRICPHQGFALGSALALQFHLEMDLEALATLTAHAGHELQTDDPGVQQHDELLGQAQRFDSNRALLFQLLDAWWAFVGHSGS